MEKLKLNSNGKISTSELTDIVTSCISEELHPETFSLLQFYIEKAIDAGRINSEILLSKTISKYTDEKLLPLIALAIRKNTNFNQYYTCERVGDCHLLIFTVQKLKENKCSIGDTLTLLNILIKSGSSLENLAFKNNKNKSELYSHDSLLEPSLNTVKLWLENNAFTVDLIEGSDKNLLALTTDNPDLLTNEYTNDVYIKFRTLKILKAKKIYLIQYSINCGFMDYFNLCISIKPIVNYFVMNRICYNLNCVFKAKGEIYLSFLTDVLIELIKIGNRLDIEQLNLISEEVLTEKIKKIYGIPKWKKFVNSCKNSLISEIPLEIKQLCFNLGLINGNETDLDKEYLVKCLSEMNSANPITLRESVIKRQRSRISINNSTPLDFIYPKNTGCLNGTLGDILYEDYNDILMIFYKTKNGCICWNSSKFEDSIAFGKDPIVGNILPSEVIEDMKNRLSLLKKLEIDPSSPISITEAVASLKINDKISSDDTYLMINNIKNLLRIEKLPFLEESQTDKMNSIVSILNIKQDLLDKLNPKHRLVTFYMLIFYNLKETPDVQKDFINRYRFTMSLT